MDTSNIMLDIPDLLDEQAAKRIKIYPHASNRASEAGHPCTRFLVLSRTDNNLRELHDVGLQRIFDLGNVFEAALMREMADAGITIVEQQRPFDWAKFHLTGRVDGLLEFNGERIPLEIKSSSPNVFRTIVDMAPLDMLQSKYGWVRKYPAQLLMYQLMKGAATGVMIFFNKVSGEKCQKVFTLEGPTLDYAETILKKLEVVNAHVIAGTKPDAVFIDDCKGCAFAKTACFVGRDYGPGIEILDNEAVSADLSRREELKSAKDEFEELDEKLKEIFKGKPATVVGDFMIESKSYEYSATEMPKEVKAQYIVKKQGFRTSIERI